MKLYEICPKCNGDCNVREHTPLDRDIEPEIHGDCSNCTDGTLWEAETFEIGKEYLDENNERHTFTGFGFDESIKILILSFENIDIEVPVSGAFKVSLSGEIQKS